MAKNNKGKKISWIVTLSILTALSLIGFIFIVSLFVGYIQTSVSLRDGTAENGWVGLGLLAIIFIYVIAIIIFGPINIISLICSCKPKSINKVLKIVYIVLNALMLVLHVTMIVILINLPGILDRIFG